MNITKLKLLLHVRLRHTKHYLRLLLQILLGSLFILVLSGSASAYTDSGAYFTCYNCTDCTNALNNNTYNETRLGADISNYNGTCIDFPVNSKTFDCQGHTIGGTGSNYGIYLSNRGNTIQNCIITGFYNGIYLDSSSNNILNNNTANNNSYGIYLYRSSDNNILNNNIANNNSYIGIYLHRSSLYLYYSSSSDNILNNNIANNNKYYGIYLHRSSYNILNNNIANNNKYYGIYLGSSPHNNLNNNTANNNGYGIYLHSSSYSWSSSYNNLNNNTANDNKYYGIYLHRSSDNNLNNNIADNNDRGIHLYSSSNNILNNNTANDNSYGIYFTSNSRCNTINSNTFCSNNATDIYDLDSNSGDNNTCNTTHNWNDAGTTGCMHVCTILAKKNYRMSYDIEGTLNGVTVVDKCAENPVIVRVFDKNGEPAEGFDVNVYLGEETRGSTKVTYGQIDSNGNFTFTPASEGVYTIEITAKHYNRIITKITVISCTKPNCSDGIQNQGEEGVDCGGPCAACPPKPNCSDGIQNQGEEGIDCGGPCAACTAPSVPPTQPATGKFPLWIIGIIVVVIGGVAYYLLVIGKKKGKG